MLYTLITQIRNGTVTIDVSVIGIEANNFKEAVSKCRKLPKSNLITHETENEDYYSFCVEQEKENGMTVNCTMRNEPLTIIN